MFNTAVSSRLPLVHPVLVDSIVKEREEEHIDNTDKPITVWIIQKMNI